MEKKHHIVGYDKLGNDSCNVKYNNWGKYSRNGISRFIKITGGWGELMVLLLTLTGCQWWKTITSDQGWNIIILCDSQELGPK